MNINDLPVYTRGIFVRSAIKTAFGLKKDNQYKIIFKSDAAEFADPDAEPIVYVHINTTVVETINKCSQYTIRAAVNLKNGSYVKYESSGATSIEITREVTNEMDHKIIKLVIEKYAKYWAKSFINEYK